MAKTFTLDAINLTSVILFPLKDGIHVEVHYDIKSGEKVIENKMVDLTVELTDSQKNNLTSIFTALKNKIVTTEL